MALTGLGGLYNLNVINDVKRKKPEQNYYAPRFSAPQFADPGNALASYNNSQEAKAYGNSSRRLAQELNRPDLITGINANETNNYYKASADAITQSYAIRNANAEAATKASNENEQMRASAHAANVEAKNKQDLMDSEIVTNAINQLYSMGGNLMNSMGQSNYLKMVAGKLFENQNITRSNELTEGVKVKTEGKG